MKVKGLSELTDENAERALLGSILIDGEALADIATYIKPEYFYNDQNAIIYRAFLTLQSKQKAIDIVTLNAELKTTGELKEVGGSGYITDLINEVPTASRIKEYARIVTELATRREIWKAVEAIKEVATDTKADITGVITTSQNTILKATERLTTEKITPDSDTLADFVKTLENRKQLNARGRFVGLTTGFRHLDEVTLGLQPGTLWVIGARPSLGKTTFLKQLCDMVTANNEGIPALFISYEQSRYELTIKSISRLAGINSRLIQKGRLAQAEEERIHQAIKDYSRIARRIYVYEAGQDTAVNVIEAIARRIIREENTDKILIGIDYLQLVPIQNGTRYDTDKVRVDRACSDLRRLARTLQSPVVAISSLNRPAYGRGGKADLSSFKESGGIEYGADIAGTMEEDTKTTQALTRKNNKPMRGVDLKIHKNRNGERAKISFTFDMALSKFEETAKSDLVEEENSDW